MMTKTSNFNGSNKTSRSCDICLHRCALWFCAADDAFLCQSCDTSVHSANQLARRHERVRIRLEIKERFIKKDIIDDDDENDHSCLVWHHGFTYKKPRTPRIHKPKKRLGDYSNNLGVLVPEINSTTTITSPNEEEIFPYENEEQLLFRVPVLDPFEMDDIIISAKDTDFVDLDLLLNNDDHHDVQLLEELCEIGLKGEVCLDKGMKFEEDGDDVMDFYYDPGLETTSESFNWDFDYSSSPIGEVEEEEEEEEEELLKSEHKMKEKREGIKLKLNHEAIISAWDCQTSPWMNGIKPDFNLDDCWLDFMEDGCVFEENLNGGTSGRCGGRDEEREARVLRYKEKRRTRLFAKKIRYEVRKLNAEKRPRMKGRFVKRTCTSSSLPCYHS